MNPCPSRPVSSLAEVWRATVWNEDAAMIDLPIGKQTFDFDCGAKALQLVLTYYGMDVREDELMKQLGTGKDGTPAKNMIAVAREKWGRVFAEVGVSLETLKEYVDRHIPVIVLVQAWADKYMTLADWREDTHDGHYAIAIGHQDGILVFEDPWSYRRTWLTDEEFLARWHHVEPRTGERLEHFAMVLLGNPPAQKEVEHMD